MTRFGWLLAAVSTGCVTTQIHARPSTIALEADQLESSGAADVPLEEGGTARVRADYKVQVWMPGAEHVLERQRCARVPLIGLKACRGHDRIEHDADVAREVTVGDLVSACSDTAPGGGGACLARQVRDEPVSLGSQSRFSGAAAASFLGSGIMFGAGAYCAAECEAKSAAVGAAGIGLLLLMMPFAVLNH